MRSTQLLIPTLREAPSDAEIISHKLMIRAGYIRKVAAGIYTYLPLCLRVLRKIERVVREEMEKSGAQELLLPIVMPAELWQETGRWGVYGPELLRFKDRHDRDFCMGPTHEEAVTDLFRHVIHSYRDLPKNCFQIQTKFRDEIRPRFGLMRGREFIMKDGYSFDRDEEGALHTYDLMYDAYRRIFTRCGLDFRPVEAMTGAIGGSKSHEFQVLAASGESLIASCSACGYAANLEKAQVRSVPKSPMVRGTLKELHTPGKGGVTDVVAFLHEPIERFVKTLVYVADGNPVLALVRGDRAVNEFKLQSVIGSTRLELASDDLVQKVTKAPVGFAGPQGSGLPVYADHEVAAIENGITGANKADHHVEGFHLGRDVPGANVTDIRMAVEGDRCARCEKGSYHFHRGIEVGQIFYLGTKYSEPMRATYLDRQGRSQPMSMGCYGIGIGRTAAAAIEQHHDERGIIWPLPIAPFQVEILPLAVEGEVIDVAQSLYAELVDDGIEVLLDDRDERPGIKFADADLIGIPYQIVIGAKGLKDGVVELKERKGGKVEKLSTALVRKRLQEVMRQGQGF